MNNSENITTEAKASGVKEHHGFASKLGFVLAAAGSAVGLGNIWRFPYLAAKYGGGIFVLVYIILAVTFGFALMVTEISIGRKTGKSVIGAYTDMNKKFTALGYVAAAVPVIIFPYYCVIGGWVLKYLTVFTIGGGHDAAQNPDYFNNFIGGNIEPLIFLIIFIGITAAIVLMGVQKGIEKISKIMMPIFIVMTIAVAIYSCILPGAVEGIKFYLVPDFSNFSINTIIAAMGQLFYSMSLAMGIMVTYGSYMKKDISIEKSTRQIEIFDTGIALLAGFMVIPAVVAFSGGDPTAINQGPGLMFVTIPKVFDVMPGGQTTGIVLFLMVALAALTSSISLMETIVSIVAEKFKIGRKTVCFIVLGFSLVLGCLSVFGYGMWADFTIMGKQLLDFFDFFSNSILMPLVALFTCILVGYVVKTKYVEDEIMLNSEFKAKHLYRVMVKFVAPVFLLLIFIWSVFMPAL